MTEPASPRYVPREALERIALEMTSTTDLGGVLKVITEGLVEDLDAAFARIWLVRPGDRCNACPQAAKCPEKVECLHLVASSGLHSNLEGEYARIPLGALITGRVASSGEPYIAHDLRSDPRVPVGNREWVAEHDLVAFGGYPLRFKGKLLGVMSIFSRQRLGDDDFHRLGVFANHAATAINSAQLIDEVIRLKDQLERENAYLREEIALEHLSEEMVGQSGKFRAMLDHLARVAETDATVLVMGETGTGKELVARTVHELSRRREKTLVKLNCAAMTATLVESELFGHERGAFTGALQRRIGRFELADRGTLFLDEVGELPLETQAKLLRVIQEGEFERVGSSTATKVDVRLIAATNRDLEAMVAAGQFRADLYYRLNVFPVKVPSLRERADDIPVLTQHILAHLAGRLGRRHAGVTPESMTAMMRYGWPGNIRELQNVLERAAILASGPLVDVRPVLGAAAPAGPADDGVAGPVLTSIVEMERRHIREVLVATDWRVEGPTGAAAILDINPSTLRSRMRKLGINRPT